MSSIELIEKPGEKACLVYTECVSKNHQGGLKHRKLQLYIVHHTEKPDQCFVQLYKKYMEHLPEHNPDSPFYLTPISQPKNKIYVENTLI